MKLRLLLLAALCAFQSATSQSFREQLTADPDLAAGIYHSYPTVQSAPTPPPAGYAPVYISHYGRHGSRYQASKSTYQTPLSVFEAASRQHALTDLGEDVLRRLRVIAADAELRCGDLTPRGEREHRGIAERMAAAYPSLFEPHNGQQPHISCHSTAVPRCMMSMMAFCERLREVNPHIAISRTATERDSYFMTPRAGYKQIQDSARLVAKQYQKRHSDDRAFVSRLFTDTVCAREILTKYYKHSHYKFFDNMHGLASIMQDCDFLGISLDDIFTPEERYRMWLNHNVRRYLAYGPSAAFGDRRLQDGKPLLRNFIEEADKALANPSRADVATLRFGHDVFIIPLLALIGVEGCDARLTAEQFDSLPEVWCDSRVSPMAVNFQMIFFRNSAGRVLVKLLHNEREVHIPLQTDTFPFYEWGALRDYLAGLCNEPK